MASEWHMWQGAPGQRRLEPGPDASREASRVTCGFLRIPPAMPLGLLEFKVPRHTHSQQSRLATRGPREVRFSGSFLGGWESILAVQLRGVSCRSLLSPQRGRPRNGSPSSPSAPRLPARLLRTVPRVSLACLGLPSL